MTRLIRSAVVLTLTIMWMAGASISLAESYHEDSANLLLNGDMEAGMGDRPAAWRSIRLLGGEGLVSFAWDETRAHSASRSLRIEGTGTARGIWSQAVTVLAGTVYEISGYVGFEGLDRASDCHLQLVFRSETGAILEFVDFAKHDNGSRDLDLDFPARMIVRAPEDATQVEVNGCLSGRGTAWFDDLQLIRAATGRIAGRVTSDGEPVADARVYLWGDPWGEVVDAFTDEDGVYRLDAVPVSHPRYILIVEKDGFLTQPVGDIDVFADVETTADAELEAGVDPADDLDVGYGFLCLSNDQLPVELPDFTPLPASAAGYVPAVRPYLESDEYITSEDPVVIALADEILKSLSAADRGNAVAVARAVFDWISMNINHDAVYGNRQPYLDVTSGIWQTIQPSGWCWGRSFYNWLYRPAELLEERVGICIEHSWLSAAVLRALNIPARARVGSAQFWVQDADGNGGWFGFSTNGGSNTYRETGRLGVGFGDWAQPTFYSVTSEPFLHEDWDWEEPGLWHEQHPWGEVYAGDASGLEDARQDLAHYAATGEARSGSTTRRPGSGAYEINYSQITLSRWSLSSQTIIDVRFPAPTESAATTDTGEWAYWTNHPECVIDTYIETIENPPVPEIQRWRHIVLDVSSLLEEMP